MITLWQAIAWFVMGYVLGLSIGYAEGKKAEP